MFLAADSRTRSKTSGVCAITLSGVIQRLHTVPSSTTDIFSTIRSVESHDSSVRSLALYYGPEAEPSFTTLDPYTKSLIR